MPFCPNCGSYIPLGNHSCDCGTTIGYDYDDEYEDDWEFQKEKRRQILQRQKENPYDDDFFNNLHHQGVSTYLINRMNDGIQKLKDNLGVELDDADIMGEIVVFKLIKHDRYFDASLKATFSLSSAFNKVKFHNNLVIPDFSKIYSDEEFQNLIKRSEAEKNSKFHGCKLNAHDDMFIVLAMFDEGGYIVDLENMELLY